MLELSAHRRGSSIIWHAYVSYSINISKFSLFWFVWEPTLLMLKAAVTQATMRYFPKDDMLCKAAVQVLLSPDQFICSAVQTCVQLVRSSAMQKQTLNSECCVSQVCSAVNSWINQSSQSVFSSVQWKGRRD